MVTQLKQFPEGWTLAASDYYIMYNRKNSMHIKDKKFYFSYYEKSKSCHNESVGKKTDKKTYFSLLYLN